MSKAYVVIEVIVNHYMSPVECIRHVYGPYSEAQANSLAKKLETVSVNTFKAAPVEDTPASANGL